jgi:hypothetical protein
MPQELFSAGQFEKTYKTAHRREKRDVICEKLIFSIKQFE